MTLSIVFYLTIKISKSGAITVNIRPALKIGHWALGMRILIFIVPCERSSWSKSAKETFAHRGGAKG